MEWYWTLSLLLGSLLVLMFIGVPVAFSFLFVIIVGAPLVWGFQAGMSQVVLSLSDSLLNFALLPIPLFVLMGEVIFRSQIAPQLIDAIDKWIGRVPGRLSLMSIVSGVLFSTLTGTSLASTAILGSALLPEMERKGYNKLMSIGPILGSGGLALMIPPSALAVLLGAVAEVSIGRLLVAIIIPGILMALLYAIYVVVTCMLKPELAPPYDMETPPFRERLVAFARYILPLGFIIFMVVGVIFVGIATPTEASATGALSCFLYSWYLKRLNWDVIKKSLIGTARITIMIFMIVAASELFAQMMAYSGAANGLTSFVLSIPASPVTVLIGIMIVVIILGMFLNSQAIIMIAVPVFMPVISSLNFDPIWFSVLLLLNIEMGGITPPFGLGLFVMKGVAPKDVKLADVMISGIPFLACDAIAMLIIIFYPDTALWLVRLMS